MATHFSSPATSASALPFLFERTRSGDVEWAVRGALAAAIAAERAVDTGRRNTRARLAWLICELGFQLARRGIEKGRSLPIPRAELAAALGTSLCRLKRTLALLSLSGLIDTDCRTFRVTDWRKLSAIAGYDPARLELAAEEDLEPDELPELREEGQFSLTASGDPACFV